MLWVKAQPMRKDHLPELLTQVRMPLLTPQYLTDHVATEELIRSSHQCRDLLDEAKDYHLMPERRPLLQSFRTRPRCCPDVVGCIYAVGGLTKSGMLHSFYCVKILIHLFISFHVSFQLFILSFALYL